jgi:alkyl sulfatase BDS1-like metallo-beta-lactamase superfamily hydrolase
MMPHPDLLGHSAQFDKKIIKLADGLWSAVGFAASNVHMIEGKNSITIVDTTDNLHTFTS